MLHWDGTSWSEAYQFRRAADRVAVPGARNVWVFGFGAHSLAPLPVSPEVISVQSIANVPGTARSFAAGFTHARFDPSFPVRAVLLQVN